MPCLFAGHCYLIVKMWFNFAMARPQNHDIIELPKGALQGFCLRREMTIKMLARQTKIPIHELYNINSGRRVAGSTATMRLTNIISYEVRAIEAAKAIGGHYIPTDSWRASVVKTND